MSEEECKGRRGQLSEAGEARAAAAATRRAAGPHTLTCALLLLRARQPTAGGQAHALLYDRAVWRALRAASWLQGFAWEACRRRCHRPVNWDAIQQHSPNAGGRRWSSAVCLRRRRPPARRSRGAAAAQVPPWRRLRYFSRSVTALEMSVPQDLFGMEGPLESGGGGGLGSRAAAPAEPAELVQELASRYDAAHHTLDADEELPGSFAARAVIGGASAVGGDAASKPPPSAGDHRGPSTPAAAGAAGPAPPGSPLDPGVGPVRRCGGMEDGRMSGACRA